MAGGDDGQIRQFSLQTLLVGVGLICIPLAVLGTRPRYVFEACVVGLGLYLIHQALYTRPTYWRGQVAIGILICLIGLASGWFGLPLQTALDANLRHREMRDELRNPKP
jgi:hypothetical protein